MWGQIYDKLKEKGLNPFPPGKHEGVCKAHYCVVKSQAQSAFHNARGVGYRLIDIILFAPWGDYEGVHEYAGRVRAALRELGWLQSTGVETPVITDEAAEAYTTSIEYRLLKRLGG